MPFFTTIDTINNNNNKTLIKTPPILSAMSQKEEAQEKYMEFRLVQQQLQQLTGHVEQMNQQAAELEISINAIREVEKTPAGNEFLAPVANGIFVAGELKDTKKLIINVGSNVTVEKTPAEVIELLQKQRMEVVERTAEAEAVVEQLSNYALKLYKEVEKKAKEE